VEGVAGEGEGEGMGQRGAGGGYVETGVGGVAAAGGEVAGGGLGEDAGRMPARQGVGGGEGQQTDEQKGKEAGSGAVVHRCLPTCQV